MMQTLFGILLALYLLTGRWSPERIVGSGVVHDRELGWHLLLEPRIWVILAMCGIAALSRRRFDSAEGSPKVVSLLPAVFLIYMMLTGLWAYDSDLALYRIYEIALMLAALLATCVYLDFANAAAIESAFWKSVILVGGLFAALALTGSMLSLDNQRIAVLGGGANAFGRNMFLFSLACLLAWHRTRWSLPWIPLAVVGVSLVVLSGSRGAMFSGALALAGFVVLARARLTRNSVLVIASLICAACMIHFTDYGHRVATLFQQRVIVLTFRERYTAMREELWGAAYELGLSQPVFGCGLAAFKALGIHDYPHNLFLEAFSEGGSIGLGLLLVVLLAHADRLWRLRRRVEPVNVACLLLMLGFSQFSGDLYDSRGVLVGMVISVITLGAASRQSRQPAEPVQVPSGAPWRWGWLP